MNTTPASPAADGPALAKRAADAGVRAQREDLIALSRRIHSHAEIGFQEVRASAWVAEYLERRSFTVTRGVGGAADRLPRGGAHTRLRFGGSPGPRAGRPCGDGPASAVSPAFEPTVSPRSSPRPPPAPPPPPQSPPSLSRPSTTPCPASATPGGHNVIRTSALAAAVAAHRALERVLAAACAAD